MGAVPLKCSSLPPKEWVESHVHPTHTKYYIALRAL